MCLANLHSPNRAVFSRKHVHPTCLVPKDHPLSTPVRFPIGPRTWCLQILALVGRQTIHMPIVGADVNPAVFNDRTRQNPLRFFVATAQTRLHLKLPKEFAAQLVKQ